MTQLEVGTLPSAPEQYAALAQLNLWADYSASGSLQKDDAQCTVSRDEFVFDNSQCSGGSRSMGALGADNCIKLMDNTQAAYTSRYSDLAFAQCQTPRSVGTFTSVNAAILAHTASIRTYMEACDPLYDDVRTRLADCKSRHDTIMQEVLNAVTRMEDFKNSIVGFLENLTGPQGVISKFNCRFVGTNLQRITNALCISFTPAIFWLSFYMGIIGCVGCCAIPCTFYLNRNYTGLSKVGVAGK